MILRITFNFPANKDLYATNPKPRTVTLNYLNGSVQLNKSEQINLLFILLSTVKVHTEHL